MDFGNQPITATVLLIPGQDFEHTITMPPGETVPVGTTAQLVIYDITGTVLATWDAVVTTTTVYWDIASTVSDTIPSPANFRIYVHYADGRDFCWFQGQVARK